MKTIRLNKLTLQNFQGRTFELETGGENTDVFAANNVGKTRLMSAFTWLLFGKDSQGRGDFEIKNIDVAGNHEHMLEHGVEGEFEIDSEAVTLKKTYREVWGTVRKNEGLKLKSHTNDYEINGDKGVKEKDFKIKVSELFGDEQIFRLLTAPSAFPSLPWKEQRQSLMNIGGVGDEEIIILKEDFAPISDVLKKYSHSVDPIEAHKKVLKIRQSEMEPFFDTKKRKGEFTIRINEIEQGLPDVYGLDLADINADIRLNEHDLNTKKLELQGINTGGRIAELSKELAIVNADIQKTQAAYREVNSQKAAALNTEIKDVQDQIRRSNTRMADIDNQLTIKKRRTDAVEAELFILRGRWDDIDAETFQEGIATLCAACGQSLPDDKVQAARDKTLAAFNNDKAERLKSTHAKGSALAEEKEHVIGIVTSMAKEKAEIMHSMPGLEEKVAVLLEKQQAEAVDGCPFDAAHAALILRTRDIETKIQMERSGKAVDESDIKDAIFKIEVMLSTAKLQADKFRQREQGEKRIAELKAQEKLLAAEFEKLEKELYLMEQFTRMKCSLLTERINGLFETVKFKLFNELVNTGIEECCVLTVDGVPYGSGLGNSASIKAGLDVVRTLQRHYKLSAPVFIDNRESCTLIPDMPCQVISLHVSPEDVVMRVKTGDE